MDVVALRRVARGMLTPAPWLLAATLIAAAYVSHGARDVRAAHRWLAQLGVAAPVALVVAQATTSATPFPSEVFTIAGAGAYGALPAALLTWLAWTLGALLEYGLARRSARDLAPRTARAHGPAWLARWPVEHPVFLVCARWLPMGAHVVNVAAGVRRVPVLRLLWTAALGSLPTAVLWATVGASVTR